MKNVLLTISLLVASLSFAWQPTLALQARQTPPASSSGQKVIKDPAEYNAYITALNTQDPAQRAAAMEAFVKQYPQSIMLVDALEQAMNGYQIAGDAAKVADVAKRILQVAPNHVRGMAILTAIDRPKASSGDAPALKEMCAQAQNGLQQLPMWQKTEGMSDADFEKLKNQIADIFNGASGLCALQDKDYANARTFYEKAFQIDPGNLQDVYQLAVADLEMNPMDLSGLWYCGKAIHLAQDQKNPQAADGMVTYCKSKFKKYHGGDDGWDQIVAGTATGNAPPPKFGAQITRALNPCELAVQAVEQNDPSTLSFSDQEFILSKVNCSPANKAAADKVWQSLQNLEKHGEAKLKVNVKVISANADTLDSAVTDENQQANKADVHVIFEKPVAKPPAPGSMIDIIGVITKYTPAPFMFTMEKGEIAAPESPAHQPPVAMQNVTPHKK